MAYFLALTRRGACAFFMVNSYIKGLEGPGKNKYTTAHPHGIKVK
jgi:hypothetical protein